MFWWLLGALLLVMTITAGLDSMTCNARWGAEGRWGFVTGCMVEVNGKMIPEERVRLFKK